jgi:hypothetical protein
MTAKLTFVTASVTGVAITFWIGIGFWPELKSKSSTDFGSLFDDNNPKSISSCSR